MRNCGDGIEQLFARVLVHGDIAARGQRNLPALRQLITVLVAFRFIAAQQIAVADPQSVAEARYAIYCAIVSLSFSTQLRFLPDQQIVAQVVFEIVLVQQVFAFRAAPSRQRDQRG